MKVAETLALFWPTHQSWVKKEPFVEETFKNKLRQIQLWILILIVQIIFLKELYVSLPGGNIIM